MNPKLFLSDGLVGVNAKKKIKAAYPSASAVRVIEGFKVDGGWMACNTNALTARRLRALRDQGFALLHLAVDTDTGTSYPDFAILHLIKGT